MLASKRLLVGQILALASALPAAAATVTVTARATPWRWTVSSHCDVVGFFQ